jgi:hypothetical protein
LAFCCAFVAAAHAAEPALHDPTQPYSAVANDGVVSVGAPAPRFRLTGVLISPTRRIAMVNGKPYQEGQRVAGAQLTHIDARFVQLRDGTHDIVIQLGHTHASVRSAVGEPGP